MSRPAFADIPYTTEPTTTGYIEWSSTLEKEQGKPIGEIVWDTSQPNGQPRRKLDTSRALERFGWKATTPLAEGLRKTLDWYLAARRL